MNCTAVQPETSHAILAFDVSKAVLNLYGVIGGESFESVVANRSGEIVRALSSLKAKAEEAGHSGVLVVAEPSGGFQDLLMRTALALGMETAWVSGEAVAKMRVIESNDAGKTDTKDPRVIHTLARLGKTLTHRQLEGPYELLREWNTTYDAADASVVVAKALVHDQLTTLFPDLSFKKDFIFDVSGRALATKYGMNPYRIVAAGAKRFTTAMKKAAPRIQGVTLTRLWRDAVSSAKHGVGERHAEVLEVRIGQLFADLATLAARKAEAKAAMEALYREAQELDDHLPEGHKGVITSFHLARIVAETGPMSDFRGLRQLMRYAGLNLRERASGTYRGKTKLSKKGRSLLRKVLTLVVLPLVKRTGLYGKYYHRKVGDEKMPGTKAMTVVARLFLKMLYGWYRSGAAFDHNRVFTCKSEYMVAA